MPMPRNVERATITNDTESLRIKLRNAPPEFRRSVDEARESRGLAPLFATATARPAATTRNAGAEAKVCKTLVGLCAPGVSEPAKLFDDEPMPEFISTAAWRGVVASLRAKPIPVTVGHGGRTVCMTNSPRFRFELCETLGLCIELDQTSDDRFVAAGGISVGIKTAKHHRGLIDGRLVRVIDELELHHIALLEGRSLVRACYRDSRLELSIPAMARRRLADIRIDGFIRLRKAWPSLCKRLAKA
jgi:hypothetical protein